MTEPQKQSKKYNCYNLKDSKGNKGLTSDPVPTELLIKVSNKQLV